MPSTRIRASSAAALTAAWLAFAIAGAADLSQHPMLGEPAPSFELATVDGAELGLPQLAGRMVVLHFGASW